MEYYLLGIITGLLISLTVGVMIIYDNLKNMSLEDMENVKKYYPEYHGKAMQLSADLEKYWGRDEAKFYYTFGKDLGQDSSCESCQF